MSVLQENDVLLLDRGFRYSIGAAENEGLKTYMPSLLKKDKLNFLLKKPTRAAKCQC